jgi:hypothetical protein
MCPPVEGPDNRSGADCLRLVLLNVLYGHLMKLPSISTVFSCPILPGGKQAQWPRYWQKAYNDLLDVNRWDQTLGEFKSGIWH